MNKRIEALRNIISDNECVFVSSYPNIFYYSGFTSGDAYLLISHEKAMIITDSRYTVQANLECPEFELYNIADGLENALNIFPEQVLYEERDVSVGFYMNIRSKCKHKSFIPSNDKISSFRQNKDSDEIKKIHQAEQLGDFAFEHMLKFIKQGMTETEVAIELEFFMRKNGASKLSFDTIVASGVRSSMPHGTASKKLIEYGDLLTLDFGCVLDGYCSDMTRTVAIGTIGEKEREIYETVLLAQNTALSNMKIGMKCSDIDKLARDVIENAGFGKNFGHSLGHSVGIQIHEAPNFSLKSEDIFKDGNVITVEPGIYIDGFCGVRIEDIVVAENGKISNLTKSPKDLIIL